MNIFILFAICSFVFVLFQMYEYSNNYQSIINFIKNYKSLKYGTSGYVNIDPNTSDPNDFVTDAKLKYRCVNKMNTYLILSVNGYYSTSVTSNTLVFSSITSCINYLFNTNSIKLIYNPCITNPAGAECVFIQNNI